jgi:hypothetical protein
MRLPSPTRPASLQVICLLIFAAASLAAGAEELEPIRIPSARTEALGGRHAALADDVGTLFSNPAGFRSAEPGFSIASIGVELSGPIFDMTSLLLSGSAPDLASADVQDLMRNLYAGLNLAGPVAFAYVGNGLGFGFYNNTGLAFSTRGTLPTVTTEMKEEFLFAGGYSFRIPLPESWNSSLDVGALLSASVVGTSSVQKDLLSLYDAFSDPLGLIFNEPFELILGIGVDLGLLYSIGDRLAVGIVGRNLYAPNLVRDYASYQDFLDSATPSTSRELTPIDLSAGVLYRPAWRFLERYVSDLKLMLDYEDILDFLTHPASSTNPLLHIGLGCELVLLDILALRGGFYQALFSAGLGLDLSVVTFNLSMYGRELSPEPGLQPVYNLLLSLHYDL